MTEPELVCTTLFQESWWLDCVCPGSWKRAIVKEDDRIVGHLAYALRSFAGIRAVTMPALTPFLGPWISTLAGKDVTHGRRYKGILDELIRQLPRADHYLIKCDLSICDLLPFYWQKFELYVRYTYVLPSLTNLPQIWDGMLARVRQQIRKAEKLLQVSSDGTPDELIEMIESTYSRQRMSVPFDLNCIRRIFEATQARKCGCILVARNSAGDIHGAQLLVWDQSTAYYVIGGSSPEGRQSGVSSLMLWRAIEFASKVARTFDFEGSMVQSIETFLSSFGGNITPHYYATKSNWRFRLSKAIRTRSFARTK